MDIDLVDQDEELAKSRVGQVVNGKWKLESLLGCGGMAAVYAAEGTEGQRVALKMLHPKMSRIRDVKDRFLREGTTANRVGHPGVVRVLEQASPDDATTVLVMELLDGESLADMLRRERRLSPPVLLDTLDQVLDVLAAAHERGIIHRDLKPDNLFVTREGRLKVLDFGIARVLEGIPEEQRTRTGVTLGTLPFMSPEQTLGKRKDIDGRTDLFAMGAIAFSAAAGRYIHQADSDAELLVAMATQPAPPLASVAADAAPELCAIVDQALAFSKEARYPDARTMQADVRAFREGRTPPYAGSKAKARSEATRPQITAPKAALLGAAGQSAQRAATANLGGARAPTRPATVPIPPHPPTAVERPATARAVASGPAVLPPTVVGPAPDAVTRLASGLVPPPRASTAAAVDSMSPVVTGPSTRAPVENVGSPGVAPPPPAAADERRRLWTIVLIAALLLCFGAAAFALGASSAGDADATRGSDAGARATARTEEERERVEQDRERAEKREEDEEKKRAKDLAKERRKRGRGKE